MQACKRHLPFAYFNRPHAAPNGPAGGWVGLSLVLAVRDGESRTMEITAAAAAAELLLWVW